MTQTAERPYRSALYIPGSKERALDKATGLPCDAIIFDLEDAVAPEEKAAARETLLSALAQKDYGPRVRILRVNGPDTDCGREDLRAVARAQAAGTRIDALLIPKVSYKKDLDAVIDLAPGLPLWAMLETAMGVLNAADIASHPALSGMVMGTNDLERELQSRFRPDRLPMLFALSRCVLAARAFGLVILDGVYTAFRDEEGLRAECEQGRDMGFDGKTVIHPAQLAVANEVFAPGAEEIALARRQIAAHEEALAAGQGVAVLDGKIVENLHIVTARRILAKAEAIAGCETGAATGA